jgi:hypothetical protein
VKKIQGSLSRKSNIINKTNDEIVCKPILDIIMKKIMTPLCFSLFIIGCNNSGNENINSLPPPPDTTIKYEILYNGKTYRFNNKIERKRFLDSLKIKDTNIGKGLM